MHLSSALADLPAPAGSSGQAAAQVLDIDKDGRDDFVITLRSVSDSILWYRRDAGGWTQFLIGEGVSTIEAGGTYHDIDGDGDLDLVFGDDWNGNKIRWWENPYPNFSPDAPWACHLIKNSGSNKHHDMVFGDFDGDGEAELVSWNQSARQLLLFEKPADPKATQPWPGSVIYSWSDGQEHEGLAAADINLDGKLDIVGGGRWFEHAGGTSFAAHVIDDGMRRGRVAVGQLHEGGRPEVILCPGESEGPLKWYEWTGSTWQGRTLLASVTHGHSLQTGDVDGDGHLDILVGEMGQWSGLSSPVDNPDAKVWVFYGDGGGNFTPQVVSSGQGVHEAKLADLDGDGDLDILGKPFRHNIPRVDVWLNHDTGWLCDFDQVVIDPTGIVYQRQVGDLDGDGRNDVVGVQEDELVWFSHPDFAGQTLVRLGPGSDWPLFRADDLKLADIDDDGDLDVVTRIGDSGDDNGKVVWFENPRPGSDASGTWTQHDIGANGYVKDIVVEDFDADGRLDVVTRERTQTQVWFQDGPDSWVKKATDHAAREGMDVGDLDGDDDPDIVLNGFWLETPADARAGSYSQHVIDSKWFTQSGGWQANSCKVVVADVDDDGKLDVVLSHSELPGYPVAWYSAQDPTGTWTEHVIAPECDYCHNLQAADFNKDGKMDVLAGGMIQSQHRGLKIYFGDGTGSNWTPQPVQALGSYSAEIGDIDDDGDVDIVTVRQWDQAPTEIWRNRLCEPVWLDNWTYIQVDDSRAKWGDFNSPDWLKYFGLGWGEVDQDGYVDIVSGRYFYRNPGGDMTGTWDRVDFGLNVDALLVVDVDGDPYGDVIGTAGATVYWLEADDQQGGSWTARAIDTAAPAGSHVNPQGYGAAQIIPGGRDEILINNGGVVTMYGIPAANPEAGNWPRTELVGNTNGEGIGVGDINGDGLLDIAVAHLPPDEPKVPRRIKWALNPGDGSGSWSEVIIGQIDGYWPDRVAVADLNGDGRPDILVTEEEQPVTPSWKTYWFEAPEDPAGGAWTRHVLVTQYTTNSMDVADMDNDGDIDVILAEHRSPDDSEKVAIWENNGSGGFAEHIVEKGKESHLGARVADLDGDGDLEIMSIAWDEHQYLHLWRHDAGEPGAPAAVDPELSVWVDESGTYPEVTLENSVFIAVIRTNDGGVAGIEHAIRDWYIKSADNEDQVESCIDASAERGPMISAAVVHTGTDRITVRCEYNSESIPGSAAITEYTIFPHSPVIKIDYIQYPDPVASTVDLGTPGGADSGQYSIYGAESWPRGYVSYPDSYWDAYSPAGPGDPADGGPLNYNGHLVMAVGNPDNGRGFGRVMPFFADGVQAGARSLSLLWGRGFLTYPRTGQDYAPRYSGYLYVFDQGLDAAVEMGKAVADGDMLIPVNVAPVMDNSAAMSLGSIHEDEATNSGTLVSSIIASAGGDRITDLNHGALEGIAVVAAGNTDGIWEYSTDGGANWSAFGTPLDTFARLLAADDNTRIRFVPNGDFNGTVADGLTFRAWDQTSGSAGQAADTSINGGATAFSEATETAGITVSPVNDAPTAEPPAAAVTVDEDSWAEIVLSGSDVETAAGDLSYAITSDPGHGMLTPLGGSRYRYQPQPDYNGPDSFQFTVTDTGDPGDGDRGWGFDGPTESAPATVPMRVHPVNDRPTAHGKALTTGENHPLIIALAGDDLETVDAAGVTFDVPPRTAHGTLTKLAHGRYRYQPDPDYFGPDSFEFTVTDTGDPAGGDQGWGYDGPKQSNAARVDIDVLAKSTRIGEGGLSRFLFHDDDGDLVVVSFFGPGHADVQVANGLTGDEAGGDIRRIVLGNTTERTTLTISVWGRDAKTAVGDIIVHGSLRALVARTAELVGDLEVEGSLAILVLGDVREDHSILIHTNADIGVDPQASVAMAFGRLADCSIHTNDIPIRSLMATEWLDRDGTADVIEAPWLGSLMTRGDRGSEDIDGDFEAGLILDATGHPGQALGYARISGALTDADWDVTGDVGTISVSGQVDGWALNVHGDVRYLMLGSVTAADVTVDGDIGVLRASSWAGGTLEAGALRVLMVLGDRRNGIEGDFKAELKLHDGDARQTLGVARITGDVGSDDPANPRVWTVAGPIGTLILGDVDHWRLDLNGDLRLLMLGAVGQADLFVDGDIGVLRASCWAGGEIRAKTLASLVVLGDWRNGIEGDFSADLTLTGAEGRQTLGVARIAGDVGSDDPANPRVWTVAGPIGTLILGDVDHWRLDLNGDLRLLMLGAVGQADLFVDGDIGVLRASCWAGGEIRAKTLASLVVLGDRRNGIEGDFSADLKLTGAEGRQTLSLANIVGDLANSTWEITGEIGRLMVIGKADHSTVRSTGGMGAVILGATGSSDFLAGIEDGVGRCAAGHEHFEDPSARIGLILIRGIRATSGQEAPRYFLCDSNFSAGCFGTIILLNGDFETGQSGVYACDVEGNWEIRLVSHRDTVTRGIWFWPPRRDQPFEGPPDFIHIL